jgi:hypothetical protein
VLGLDRSNPKILDAQLVGDVFLQVGIKIDSKRDRKKKTYERWINKESLTICQAYHQHKLRQKAEREAKAQAKLEALAEVIANSSVTIGTTEKPQAVLVPEQKTELEQLVDILSTVSTAEDFASIAQIYSLEMMQDAIVYQPEVNQKHLLNHLLRQWLSASASQPELAAAEVVESAIANRPMLEDYQPGQQVWAFFPQSQDKWLKATVQWVRENLVRVESGFLGMLIGYPDLIAPGDWVLS